MKSKRPPDIRGGHTRLYWTINDSPAWRALGWSERCLWLALRRKLLSGNNGNIEATLGQLKHAGFGSSATLSKGLRALLTLGFIAKTRQGGIAYGQKVCCLYRFTDEPTFEQAKNGIKAMKATNEWTKFDTIKKAKAAVREAHEAAKRHPPPMKSRWAFRI